MKKLHLNWLRGGGALRRVGLVLVLCLTAVGQMWGWTAIYLNSSFTETNWGEKTYEIVYPLGGGGDNQAHRFLPIYTSGGDVYWRFYHGNNYTISPASDNYVIGYGTKYQVKGNGDNNFKTNVYAGVIAVHSHQAMTENKEVGDVNGSNDEPAVWMERPTIYIWHNWSGTTSNWGDNNGSGQKAMTDNNNGTYTYDGVYSASGTNVGIVGDGRIKKWFTEANTSKVGSPTSGDKCRFTWNSNGYKGYDGEEANRGTLTITKLWKITYDGNGNGGGSAPDDEYVMHNTATATYTNTGSMTKTNMAFIGWNERADGTGTHYDAGANITLTADKTLYAEWVPCWVLRGGDTDGTSNGTQDAMGNWGVPIEMEIIGTNAFMLELNLAASTTYYFKICDRHNGKKADYSTYKHYSADGTMSGTTLDWNFYDNVSPNCRLSTGADGAGTWRFAWNANSKVLCVYKKADAPKSSFVSGKYLYLDARTNSNWKAANTKAKFWFKNLATGEDDGNVVCNYADRLEGGVYYAVVPADKTLGAVQMNNRNQSNDNLIYSANVAYARDRSNANQNSMVTPSSGGNDITLTWGTYCPPMSTATLSDNSTTRIVWQDAGNDGTTEGKAIWVSTSNTIEVSGAATKAVNDDNMTINYDFKVGGSSAQDGSTSTYSKGSLSNGTTYTITMDAYNSYNGSTGTKLTASQTLYYKAYNTYSVTNTLTNISSSGRSGDNAVAHGVGYETTLSVGTGYNLPTSVTVECGESTLTGGGTNYSYNSSTGALNINDASVTGNITIIASGDAKTYTEANNLDKNGGDSHGQYTATYDATTISISIETAPTKENYHVEGYYLESGCTNKIADAEGNLVSGVTVDAVQYTDGDGKWKKDGNVTLYTKWEENSFTVTINNGDHGTASTSSITGHPLTTSSSFTVTPAAGWACNGWTISPAGQASITTTESTISATTFTLTATANVTITPIYSIRYALFGSLESSDSPGHGMPGWAPNPADGFSYDAEEDEYTLELDLTKPNDTYKFRILDGRTNTSWGLASSAVIAENTATTLGSTNADAQLATAGRGTYTLTVTEVDDGAHPQVSIENPTSYLVHFGKKAFTPDGDELGDLDATITVTDDAGNTYADGKYIASGETVEIEASEVEGYTFVGWFADDSYSYEFGDKKNPHSWTVSEAVNAYAKYEEDANIFEGDVEGYETEWSQGDNWSKERVPRISDVVYINKPVIVNTSAKAKRVIISNNGDTKTGKLTINAGKKLIVAQTIRKYDGSSLVATTENDIVINSDGTNGVGALIWGEANTSPGAATVNFYSKSGGSKNSAASVNQFIGTPFTSETSSWLYNYYNSWVLGVNYSGSTPAFYPLSNETMDPFKGYCIIYNGSTGHTYNMSGTLVTNADHTCSSLSYKSGDASNMANENLLANPWLAPIKIAEMETTDFTNAPATIYIFNSTSEETNGSKTVTAGNYASYPIKSASDNVIPAMQSFSVFTTAASGSVALDYSKIVYDPAGETNPVANKAPKRVAEEEANKVRVFVSAESGYGDMVYMWERSDFSEGFENGWDGHKIQGDKEAPQFYAVTPDGNMAVNCVPNYEGTILGFKAGTEDDTYTFSFEYNNEADALYLYDIDENKYTRVLEGNTYTFSTTDKTEHNRFFLTRNMPQNPTGIENKYQDGVKAVKFLEDGKLFILRSGKLYDATGALVK